MDAKLWVKNLQHAAGGTFSSPTVSQATISLANKQGSC